MFDFRYKIIYFNYYFLVMTEMKEVSAEEGSEVVS